MSGENTFLLVEAIVLDDTNEKGLDQWQEKWLEKELKKTQGNNNRFVFMHVPLFDPGLQVHAFFMMACYIAVIGTILGDNINYYLGKKYGARWIKDGVWFLKPEHLEKGRVFFNTHGAKSVFLGRFIPSVKEIVPFFAGSVRMRQRPFFIWNVLRETGWGFEWVGAGYVFSHSP